MSGELELHARRARREKILMIAAEIESRLNLGFEVAPQADPALVLLTLESTLHSMLVSERDVNLLILCGRGYLAGSLLMLALRLDVRGDSTGAENAIVKAGEVLLWELGT